MKKISGVAPIKSKYSHIANDAKVQEQSKEYREQYKKGLDADLAKFETEKENLQKELESCTDEKRRKSLNAMLTFINNSIENLNYPYCNYVKELTDINWEERVVANKPTFDNRTLKQLIKKVGKKLSATGQVNNMIHNPLVYDAMITTIDEFACRIEDPKTGMTRGKLYRTLMYIMTEHEAKYKKIGQHYLFANLIVKFNKMVAEQTTEEADKYVSSFFDIVYFIGTQIEE
ncbi:MAG: hypothetical protein ACRC92_26760 [Peptostreptococcaceae bacterium]